MFSFGSLCVLKVFNHVECFGPVEVTMRRKIFCKQMQFEIVIRG